MKPADSLELRSLFVCELKSQGSHGFFSRLLAHLLIRLLVVSPLPASLQARAAFFPVSLLAPLVATASPGGEEAAAEGSQVPQDAWGNFRFPSELNADGDTVAAKNRFAFTGYLWDKETNLFFAKARFYDPEVGRFISQDSYLGQIDEPPSLHRYFYANDNPTRYIDPTGHMSFRQWIGLDKPTDSVAKEFAKNFGCGLFNAVSLGTLGRQDKLVEQYEAGKISNAAYWGKTGVNAGTAVATVAAATATGGLASGAVAGLGDHGGQAVPEDDPHAGQGRCENRRNYLMAFPKDGIGKCCSAQLIEHFEEFMRRKSTIAAIAKQAKIGLSKAGDIAKEIEEAIPSMIQFK